MFVRRFDQARPYSARWRGRMAEVHQELQGASRQQLVLCQATKLKRLETKLDLARGTSEGERIFFHDSSMVWARGHVPEVPAYFKPRRTSQFCSLWSNNKTVFPPVPVLFQILTLGLFHPVFPKFKMNLKSRFMPPAKHFGNFHESHHNIRWTKSPTYSTNLWQIWDDRLLVSLIKKALSSPVDLLRSVSAGRYGQRHPDSGHMKGSFPNLGKCQVPLFWTMKVICLKTKMISGNKKRALCVLMKFLNGPNGAEWCVCTQFVVDPQSFSFRTRELPGNYPFVVQQSYINECVGKWREPAQSLLQSTYNTLSAQLRQIIRHHFAHFGHGMLEHRIRYIYYPEGFPLF